jgi:hypothetical protein
MLPIFVGFGEWENRSRVLGAGLACGQLSNNLCLIDAVKQTDKVQVTFGCAQGVPGRSRCGVEETGVFAKFAPTKASYYYAARLEAITRESQLPVIGVFNLRGSYQAGPSLLLVHY